ncbi:MAG: magnesium transporter CorA family protein, partial [Candidatus Moraniibacteriota bacterium]
MRQIQTSKVTWIDFSEPDADELLDLKRKFKLHPLAVEEFTMPSARPKASLYGNCLYLTIHVPLFDKENRRTFPSELDIVLTDKYLITGHDQDIFQLRDFFQRIQRSKKMQEKYMSQSPGYLLYFIIEDLLESCFPKIDHINKNLDKVEDEIFKGNEKEMVHEISFVKRDILNFRRALKPQKSVLESLARDNYPMIGADLRTYYQDLIGTNIRVWSALENAKETIESLEGTNDALLSNKLNTTMKVLTIFSVIIFSMTFSATLLSMNTQVPFSQNLNAFWIYLAGILAIPAVMIIIFKVKKWI